ncbi:MAG: 1-acyl-sn-glycerol-3-phosphate acyltransferase [Candidatus Aminicenantes bacterium]|nr:1-acyl-sn-glycerol-3-phosphate acyltransferase [Candidatus Aminicenantes bacterium]
MSMKRAATVARSLLIWCLGLPWFAFWALVVLLVGIFRAGALFEGLLKWLCRSLVWICGIRVAVSGFANCRPDRQYILMMNHVNLFDGFVFYQSYPGKARGIEEESHFGWPFYGWVIRRMGQVPVNRRSGARAMESLRRAAEWIRSRRDFSFIVLPEGTRTRDGRLGPFKKGGFLLALETGLDILPLVQKGAYGINRRQSLLVRPGRVEFIIEKPVATAGYARENIAELIEKVRSVFLRYVE